MPDTSIAPFDPAAAASALRDKIRQEVAALIPDAQWEEMIRREIKLFLDPVPARANPYGMETPAEPSPCSKMVADAIRERMQRVINQRLDEFMQEKWDHEGQTRSVSEAVAAISVEAAPAILAKLLQTLVQHAVLTARTSGMT